MSFHFQLAGLLMYFSSLLVQSASADENLIGSQAKPWQVTDWINSKPLSLKDLKGKVVLIRWWTAGGCPFCTATAPALNEFHQKFQGKGLVVIGFYHHKSSAPLKMADVKEAVRELGFKFPVAVDANWRTLRSWWLDKKRLWTSVSFLIDRKGVIRHLHPGGKYVAGDRAYKALKVKIEELLKDK
jgi:peroxiredoxin